MNDVKNAKFKILFNSAEKLLSNRRLIYNKYTQKNNIKKTCSFGQLVTNDEHLNIDSIK